jgi:hypothetical protein
MIWLAFRIHFHSHLIFLGLKIRITYGHSRTRWRRHSPLYAGGPWLHVRTLTNTACFIWQQRASLTTVTLLFSIHATSTDVAISGQVPWKLGRSYSHGTKSSLSLIKQHVMKTCGGLNVKGQFHASAALPQGAEPPLGSRLSGTRSRSERRGEERNSLTLQGTEPWSLCQPSRRLTELIFSNLNITDFVNDLGTRSSRKVAG